MRRKLTILLTVLLMLVTGMTLTYAAFPLDAQNEKTTTIIDNARADDEPKAKDAATAPKTDDAHKHTKGGKSQIIAAVLAFFVGVLGIHRFYLGYTWQGVVQLLTGGGCGIWALIDFIRILIGDLGPKTGKYEKTF